MSTHIWGPAQETRIDAFRRAAGAPIPANRTRPYYIVSKNAAGIDGMLRVDDTLSDNAPNATTPTLTLGELVLLKPQDSAAVTPQLVRGLAELICATYHAGKADIRIIFGFACTPETSHAIQTGLQRETQFSGFRFSFEAAPVAAP